MREITQTKIKDENSDHGNCLAAAIASILEIEIETIPGYLSPFTVALNNFLSKLGKTLIVIEYQPGMIIRQCQDFFIIVGDSPRFDCYHAVVGHLNENWQIATYFDPHPSREGLKNFKYLCFIGSTI